MRRKNLTLKFCLLFGGKLRGFGVGFWRVDVGKERQKGNFRLAENLLHSTHSHCGAIATIFGDQVLVMM